MQSPPRACRRTVRPFNPSVPWGCPLPERARYTDSFLNVGDGPGHGRPGRGRGKGRREVQITRAIITAAGRGARQYPAFDTAQKAMLPLVDRDGLTKPVLQIIAEEALDSGIEEIGVDRRAR